MAATRKTPTTRRASTADEWLQGVDPLLDLPSGKTVEVNNPGLRVFLQEGLVPNGLLGVVKEALDQGKEPDMAAVLGDSGLSEQAVDEMMEMVDRVFLRVVTEPKFLPEPDDGVRKKGQLYIGMASDEDKMFVFQWVTGGTRDVEQFREELAAGMAALPSGESVGVPAKRAARPRSRAKAR